MKEKRSTKEAATNICEGFTYDTECGGTPAAQTEEANKEIPPPMPQSAEATECLPHLPLVFFNLETTGFGYGMEITQIAAVHKDQKFSQYVLPVGEITVGATDVTSLSV